MNQGWMNSKPQSVPAHEFWRAQSRASARTTSGLDAKAIWAIDTAAKQSEELIRDVVNGVLAIWPQFSQEAKTSAGLLGAPTSRISGFCSLMVPWQ